MAPHLTALTVTDLSKAVPCPLSPGEVLAHHPLTWHMSPPNSTTRSRCGWSLTFLHPETRWNPAHAPHPLNHQLQPKPWSPLCTERFPRTQIGEA
jgi:ectoine hydroxylase-related dioxygenase (phytanoyl-CoA dioxygenase family)